jgi:hypothetical protein
VLETGWRMGSRDDAGKFIARDCRHEKRGCSFANGEVEIDARGDVLCA